jgi:RNA polymerase sigma factor (sigma-70 family)
MAHIPTTSTTLLRDLVRDSQHARWGEFVARYRPMMEAFMRERFPSLDADDVIQETLIELIRVFPVYRYSPKEKGHFHNYLTGVLRHRALRMLGEEKRRAELSADMRRIGRAGGPMSPEEADDAAWRESLLEIALQQLLADSSIHERTRIVFARVAVNGEKPEDVAAAFGIERNAVDQMKSRMMTRLKELVAALEKADGI